MPIEVVCPKCSSTLSVNDEHAGKMARCPKCEEVFPIPAAGGNLAPALPSAAAPVGPRPSTSPDFTTPQSHGGSIPSGSHNPYVSAPPQTYRNPHANLPPHRGEMVLILGLLGLLVCPLLGIAPVVMASRDLPLIDSGRMNPSGRGLVVAGKVLGWVSIVLVLLQLVILFCIFFAMFVGAAV